uniref:Conserved secreted protein n=1 Tax=Steinernema glaseri TaxID=37863 RepID=A0A1I8ACD3_9BILA
MRSLSVIAAFIFAFVLCSAMAQRDEVNAVAMAQRDEVNAAYYDVQPAPMAKRVHGLSLLRKGKLFRQQAQKRQFGNEYLWNYLQQENDY